MTDFGPSSSDDMHLKNVTINEVQTEPPENRDSLSCDGTLGNICQPCGVRCDQMMCSNQLCSIACLDKDFLNRTKEPNKLRLSFVSVLIS